MDTKKILLTKTVVYQGKHYLPDTDHDWPADLVDELIDKEAGELVLDVVAAVRPDQAGRKEKIVFACLEAAEAGDVTTTGSPSVSAIEKITGFSITGAERDEAWETLKQEGNDA